VDITVPYIATSYCPFCRDCLAQGLRGRYDYLDGIMIAQSCMHIRQSFGLWQLHLPISYSYYLPMPHHVQSPRSRPFLTGELQEFKRSVEKWIGKTITDDDLDRAVEIYNTNRRLMKEVYESRKNEEPSLTGTDALLMVLSSQLADKAEHSRIVKQALKELPNRKLNREVGARLMGIGSENDDIRFLEMVESLGATFVIEDHCTGSRYFWNEVVPNKNRLAAIADRYIDRVPCPNKDWPERERFPHIVDLAKQYNVQGAMVVWQKFCNPHQYDTPALTQLLNENGIPSYVFEFDVIVPMEQFRTRAEAFLETLREEALF
jgi:benzoyl-CoA reductase subunit C